MASTGQLIPGFGRDSLCLGHSSRSYRNVVSFTNLLRTIWRPYLMRPAVCDLSLFGHTDVAHWSYR